MDLAIPVDHRVKIKEQIPGPCQRTKKATEHVNDRDALRTITKHFIRCVKALEIGGRVETIQTII